MAEYIEREFAIKQFEEWVGESKYAWEKSVKRKLQQIPAADVRPERRGVWSDAFGSLPRHAPYGWRCSACGDVAFCMHLYCPNCGAKMDVKSGG
ncbi:MAG: hypothetical protein OSJ43_06550 [Oscillospiraceae bacterium]|nr:hypothetical protein [Oscillospiraceae bacterium]